VTRLVVVSPSTAVGLAVGLEQGAIYTLTGPTGVRAVFNDPTDRDFVGWLNAPPSGLDGANTRAGSEDIPEGDGAIPANGYLGARPWTLSGIVDVEPRLPGEELLVEAVYINQRIERIKDAARALRDDATLTWSAQGGAPVMLRARRSQRPVFSDRWPKTFLISMESADPRIVSQIVNVAAATGGAAITARNNGTWGALPIITLRDTWTNPIVASATTGEDLRLTGNGGLSMTSGDILVLDAAARTVTLNGTVNRYDRLAFPTSEWFEIVPGDNALSASGGGSGASWQVAWRDTWE
jgi:hypothetical protein